LIDINFDAVVFSEIWSTIVEFYSDIVPDCNFDYTLQVDSNVGGVGIFINKKLEQLLMPQFKIHSPDINTMENIWTEIAKGNSKYIIGGIYRHPNHEFMILQNLHICLKPPFVN
jgi:hypothetical protein